MNLQEIQNLTLEQCYSQLLFRIFGGVIPSYSLDFQEENFYNKLTFLDPELKPTLEQMENELSSYKAELQVIEEARLAEIARREAMQLRFDSIANLSYICHRNNLVQDCFNEALFVKSIIDSNDETILTLLESKNVEYLLQLEVNSLDQLRSDRDTMLSKTDFSQLADAPFSSEQKANYRDYRSFLRSLPTLISQQRYSVSQGVISLEEYLANKASYILV